MTKKIVRAIIATLISAVSWAASGQTFPSKPILLVNPYAPGAGVDPVARLVAQKLSERFGQQVIVENKMGAAGMIGAAYVARAKPDGYTIMMSASGDVAINQHLYKNMQYNPVTDLTPITQAVRLPFLFVVNPSVPARNVQELTALTKEKPTAYSYGSGGNGSLQHLAGALFTNMAGAPMMHVPYKAVAPALSDVLGNQISALFVGVPGAIQYVKSGKLQALGVTSRQRMDLIKEVPTLAEQGLPDFEITQWFGVFAPANTPSEIVRFLNQEIVAVLNFPDVREKLLAQGAEPVGSSPEEFGRFLKAEIKKFEKLVKISGAKVDQ
jgi:tripartite-type tricarboxylate transporter receptor subunit TctC